MKQTLLFVCFLLIAGLALIATAQSQMPPAPQADRVGYPEGYQTKYQLLYTLDRPDIGQIRVIYGNAVAAGAQVGTPFPHGSILVMEIWRAKQDSQGNAILDPNGRFQRGELTTIFVMRKEIGFGLAYGLNRNGEWEYVAYRPDKSYQTTPPNSASSAICHLQVGQARDYVFRTANYMNRATGAVPHNLIQNYLFSPGVIRVKAGTTVTWYNDDEVTHRIAANDGSFASQNMPQGASFSRSFNEQGQFDYRCPIHPQMRATVVVVDSPALQLTNITSSSRDPDFWTGDRWRLEINSASRNSPVYLRLWRDGQDLGISGPYGSFTDAQGNWSLSGTFGSGDTASWQLQALIGDPSAKESSRRFNLTVSNRP